MVVSIKIDQTNEKIEVRVVAPKLKSQERFEQLLDVFHSDSDLDDVTFRIILREVKSKPTAINRAVEGLAYVAKGKHSQGIAILEELIPSGDANHAKLFCHILFKTSNLEKLDQCIYDLADKFQTKWLTFNAASVAYLLGRLSICAEYMDKHIKLLSDDEGREEAKVFKAEAIEDLSGAYQASECTSAQLKSLGLLVDKVLRIYPHSACRAEVSGKSGGSYVVEVMEVSPEQIAAMNARLADEICSDESLDSCKVVARFSPDRKPYGGAKYAYY